MSHPVCYNRLMIIETDMKKETLFEVLTFDGDATLGFIKAYNADHAKRISERLYCKGVLVQPVEGRFERFKEFNR
jgi:hypothetical protein